MNPPRNNAAMPGNDWIPIADLIAAFDCRVSLAGLIAAAESMELLISGDRINIPAQLDDEFAQAALWKTRESHAQAYKAGTS